MALPRRTLVCKHIVGARTNGKFVRTGTTDFTINASVHVVTGAKLATLSYITTEDGRVYELITDAVLRTLKEGPDADIVIIDNREFRVLSAAEWTNGILPHKIYITQEIIEK